MTIYIVTSGEYSDYHIEAVFTNQNQAELYCSAHRECEIEEWETDDVKISPAEVFLRYDILFDDKLSKVRVTSNFTIRPDEKKEISIGGRGFWKYGVAFTTKREITEEQAIKIARDYVYQYLMEKIEHQKSELERMKEQADWDEGGEQ